MAVEPAKKRLFDHAPVDDDVVVRLLSAGWGADALLKDRLKSSQNVTYSARMPGGCKASVRATRCDAAVLRRIEAEVRFVCAMADAGVKGVCEPLPPGLQHDEDSGTAVVVCRWAGGAMCKYTDWRWATVEPLVKAQGRFLGRLHAASKAWRAANPAAAAAVQRWDELHDGILKGAASERLLSVESSPDHFGVIHGDINPSNYHVLGDDAAADVALDVFDWDQVHQGWFASDLAQAVWGVRMSAADAPVLNERQFTEWLVEGYVSGGGTRPADDVLEDAVLLKRAMYERFCRRALDEGDVPPEMKPFLEATVKKFDDGAL